MAAPNAKNVTLQPPSSIEAIPIAYITGVAGAVLTVSNVDQFADGQLVSILSQAENGPSAALQLAASNAVDRINNTLTLSSSPSATAGTNEVQTLTGGTTLAGSYALGFGGYWTTQLLNTATATEIQAALRALPSINLGIPAAANVTVTGGPLNTATPLVVTFVSALGKRNVALIQINSAGISVGTITPVETTPGAQANILPSIGYDIIGPPLLSVGGTMEGLSVSEKPETFDVNFDQDETTTKVLYTRWAVELRTTLMEWDLSQIGILTQNGYTTRAQAAGVSQAQILSNLRTCSYDYGLRVIMDKQDCYERDLGLHDYYILYRAASINGIETVLSQTAPRSTPLVFRGLADSARPRGQKVRRWVREQLPAL